ncbi:MAG: hypothetical protein NTY35_02355 [Planctomycetota bacterium]|nr:hypothetical protein [Planctomycetota bacterium]
MREHLEALAKDGEVETAIIAIDCDVEIVRDLERMPFDLMDLGDDGALAILPGLASAQPGSAPAASAVSAWSILGELSSTNGESVLPGARAEVDTIARLVNAVGRPAMRSIGWPCSTRCRAADHGASPPASCTAAATALATRCSCSRATR